MKNILLLATFFLQTGLFAQCVADVSAVNEGANPFTLDLACQDVAYADTLTMVYPTDTTISSPFGPITIPYDSLHIAVIDNLPPGLTFQCSTSNCTVEPNVALITRQCVQFFGTPTSIPADDSIVIHVTGFITVFGTPQTIELEYKAKLPMGQLPPPATWTFANTGLAVQFTNTTSGNFSSAVWDFGDGGTSSNLNPVHTYGSASTYSACLTVTNDCGSNTECKQVAVPGTSGVAESDALTVSMFPNPSTGSLFFRLTEATSNITIVVKNLMGQTVKTASFSNAKTLQLELPDEAGIYWVEVSSGDGRRTAMKAIRE